MIYRIATAVISSRVSVLMGLLCITEIAGRWMFRVSLMEVGSSISLKHLLSSGISLGAYAELFSGTNTLKYFFNSVLVGIVVTLGNILFCFMVEKKLWQKKRSFARKMRELEV